MYKLYTYYHRINAIMDIMKCEKCGFENKDTAKFCSKCGNSLEVKPETGKNNNSKIIIAALVIIIVILAVCIGYFALNNNSNPVQSTSGSQQNTNSSSAGENPQQTTSSQSSPSESKEWKLIGSYSGSGTGSQSVNVPAGQIMVKISSFPIKNYAYNHLYAKGSNGQSAGVDWGPTSDVETRSDSVSYTSSSPVTFNIDYYETVSWQVEFYRYQ